MPIYSTAVQGAFQLISEAYEFLSASAKKDNFGTETAAENSGGATGDNPADDSQPIYM
jgi:DnaJ-class molecular chaperone